MLVMISHGTELVDNRFIIRYLKYFIFSYYAIFIMKKVQIMSLVTLRRAKNMDQN